MPHGTLSVGGVQITALCDLEAPFPRSLPESFPDVPPEAWPELRDLHPRTVHGADGWAYHDHCYLVRAAGTVLLFDAGVGPPSSVCSRWMHPPGGRLPLELETAGVRPEDVDVVVMSHLHLDHIGWTVAGEGDEAVPFFPRARYLVQRADHVSFQETADEDDREAFEQSIRVLERTGRLELLDGEATLLEQAAVFPTPGHTPGSQSLVVGSDGERALILGDVANHPYQVTHPEWRSRSDQDPDRAAHTRRALFQRIETQGLVFSTAHFPEPFGRVLAMDERRYWSPLPRA
ncbi:MAG: MBL fold metallo-hydrolase [Actinobacteria bacterium]|nr:MBL fold metallo-hydrolase [Actinomycetota bacterium]